MSKEVSPFPSNHKKKEENIKHDFHIVSKSIMSYFLKYLFVLLYKNVDLNKIFMTAISNSHKTVKF